MNKRICPSRCWQPAPMSVLALVLLITGCASPRVRNVFTQVDGNPAPLQSVTMTNQIDPSWTKPSEQLFTLGPGDRLEVEILGETNSNVVTIVAPDGKLYYNLLPGIDVWGLTLSEARNRLENAMSEFVRERPQISLVLRAVESKRIWVLGRVQAPGVYPIATPTTLLEAISLAGGTLSMSNYRDQEAAGIGEEMADLERSFVIREGKVMPINFDKLIRQGDVTQNIYLQPDDFVYFPSAASREIYVLGAVVQPKSVPYTEGMTVAAAVASAYGTLKGAWLTDVAVVRGSLTQPQVAIVDYKRVIRGEVEDIALQPRDIVYVPVSPYSYIQRYLELILNTFVSSAAINAGIKSAGIPSGGTAGVFIPVGSGITITPPATPPPIR